jgi:hypothetical protein
MKLSRSFFGVVVTIAGLIMTALSLAAFGWGWVSSQGQVALLLDSSLAPLVVAVFLAGVAVTLGGMISLIVLLSGVPPKSK